MKYSISLTWLRCPQCVGCRFPCRSRWPLGWWWCPWCWGWPPSPGWEGSQRWPGSLPGWWSWCSNHRHSGRVGDSYCDCNDISTSDWVSTVHVSLMFSLSTSTGTCQAFSHIKGGYNNNELTLYVTGRVTLSILASLSVTLSSICTE